MPKSIFLFIPAIFIVLLLAAISSEYQILPTPTIFTSQEEFEDYYYPKFNFGFKFPKSWGIYGDDFGNNFYLKTPNHNSVSFSIIENYQKDIGKFLEEQDLIASTSYEGKPSVEIKSTDKIIINGLSCIQRQEYLFAKDGEQNRTFCKNGSDIIIITFDTTPGSVQADDYSKYQNLLSTISFGQKMAIKIYLPGDSDTCTSTQFEEIYFPKTPTPLKDSLEYLIGSFSGQPKVEGFKLVSAVIRDGVATITLEDPNFFTTGGSCFVGSLQSQFEQTALQFPTVKKVKFLGPSYLFEP